MNKKIVFSLIFSSLILLNACEDNEPAEEAVYDDTPYSLDVGTFPPPPIAADNPLTNEGVALGKMLFYDTRLSKNGEMSCATCHVQGDGFSDINRFSEGVEGELGGRQAMAVFNMAWHRNGFFWDGRAPLLRDQSLLPIQDPLEMNETLENVVSKLEADPQYKDQFIRAFGSDEITSERMSLAMEQFMNSIVSVNAKWDQVLAGTASFTESEQRGRELFFEEFDPITQTGGAECFHCHGGFNFTNDKYMNNGLDAEADWTDLGLYDVTEDANDKAKFKTPSLRNIELTPPYMHDGRFATLEEVIDHYNEGVVHSSTIDPLMQFNLNPGLLLTEQDKADLVAFLKTLTDQDFIENTEYQSPF
jgi:cytochrome c peroxidase